MGSCLSCRRVEYQWYYTEETLSYRPPQYQQGYYAQPAQPHPYALPQSPYGQPQYRYPQMQYGYPQAHYAYPPTRPRYRREHHEPHCPRYRGG
jgi:hypothetical protein